MTRTQFSSNVAPHRVPIKTIYMKIVDDDFTVSGANFETISNALRCRHQMEHEVADKNLDAYIKPL